MAELKCPCHLRNDMGWDDCDEMDCNECCPLAEAEPVKHGRWERVPSNGIGATARCSICGKAIYGYHTMNYCPHCGARMDGE